MATAIFPFTALSVNNIPQIDANGNTGRTVAINAEEIHYAFIDADGNIFLQQENYDSLTMDEYILDGENQTLNTLMANIIGADADTAILPVIIYEKDNQTIDPAKTVLLNRTKILKAINLYDVNGNVSGTEIHYGNNLNDHFSVIKTTFNLLDTTVYS
jgi:hypothetical protein